MHLDLSDDETAALTKELDDITGNDRHPFSTRIRTRKAILANLRREPVREPLPRPTVYTPPHYKPQMIIGRQDSGGAA